MTCIGSWGNHPSSSFAQQVGLNVEMCALQHVKKLFFNKHDSLSLSLPVEYCGSLCSPSVSKSPYLQTVGEDLLPNITVIWTGEKQYFILFCRHTTGSICSSVVLFCFLICITLLRKLNSEITYRLLTPSDLCVSQNFFLLPANRQ